MVKDRSVCYENRLRMLGLFYYIKHGDCVGTGDLIFDNVTYTDFYTI